MSLNINKIHLRTSCPRPPIGEEPLPLVEKEETTFAPADDVILNRQIKLTFNLPLH